MNFTLETERLLLRPITKSDVEGSYILDCNPNVHNYLGNNPITSREEAAYYIDLIQKQYVANGIGRFAVVLKDTDEFIGWAGIKFLTEPENGYVNVYEIGYRLQEQYWGKGYGTEAAKAWLSYGFEHMNIATMHASVNKENSASLKILTNLAMQITSEFLWKNIPCYWLELSKDEFENKERKS